MKPPTGSAFVLVALLASTGAAAAAERGGRGSSGATFLPEGDTTVAPMAFVAFCMRYKNQCLDSKDSGKVVELTESRLAEMRAVNKAVNARIAPDSSKGGDGWSLETRVGNCNDYAVQKRDELSRHGYPASALSLATVMTRAGQGHLVLTVRTNVGDYVLDNLQDNVLPWTALNYSWLKRQSAERPRYWVDLNDGIRINTDMTAANATAASGASRKRRGSAG
ncbi:transglutaminase-like cysteine peptidase [Methylorubrum extorquens]